ncbi:MAG: FUSC family protein [Nocardioidaceae bacterium]
MHHGLRGWLAESRDRLLASDPGLGRLRQAFAAAVALGTALGVEYAFARLAHASAQGTLISMMLGAMVAMMGSNALTGPEVWGKVKVAVFFPVAIGLGMGLGTLVGGSTDLMLAVFVAVMFVAVFIRRFGMPFFFYGFMIWMGYFFASFLHTTPAMIPNLLLAVVIGAIWVLLLSVTVLRTNPRKVMRSTLQAFESRARWVARECADLLEVAPGRDQLRAREQRRLNARQAGLAEAALMAEGWSEDEGALPDGWSGPALRRRLLETQQTVERIAAASAGLREAEPALRRASREVVHRLARREDRAARAAAERLAALGLEAQEQGRPGGWHARHLAAGAVEFLDLSTESRRPPEVAPVDDDFSPTTPLFFGNLPGSPAVAREVQARGFRWNPLTRLDMPTRQAVQVALAGAIAIVLGRILDPTRYYWAVIAAFVMFTGTGTRTESFLKGVNRVAGTLVGLVAAIVFAHFTNGHTLWIIVTILLSVFFGFYLVRISYAYMIFFITIMIGQLYTVLHTFSDALLVLRLEETAVGALAGIVVAVVVTPLSTRDTVRSAGGALLDALGELLTAVAEGLEGTRPDLDALSRALDDRAHRLQLVTKPLTRPLVWRNQSQHTRHRLGLYVSTAVFARGLTVALRRHVTCDAQAAADVCRALAEACAALSAERRDRPVHAAAAPLERADEALFRDRSCTPDADPVLRPLLHVHATLAELAQGGRPAPAEPPREAVTAGA